VDVWSHLYLIPSVVGTEWSALRPGVRTRYNHFIGGSVGPQNRSERRGKEEVLDHSGTRTPTPLPVIPVASRSTDYAIPAPGNASNKIRNASLQ
jgi:hypothetical protein